MKKKTKKKFKKAKDSLFGFFNDFQKQRKKGKGVGGFLQRIADNQK